jgi:serine/threonine protein kinase/Tfp pilus assembly protein PilF
LGEGGMGAVYKAHDRELARDVALKLIRPELAKNPETLARFKQELLLARQVTHRNVIRIFDIGQAGGLKFITMEYLEGLDLRGVLREKGKLAPEEAAKIILQICRALEVAHGEGVIHRDLKPQNIMLDATGRAYVMDFGIARSAYLPGMTQTGALVGTPEYMSPEQAKGEKLDERSDLFSLGVIFYELLTGQSPYHSDTPLATLWRRIQEKAKPLDEIDPTIPKPLSDIVAKALEIEPNDRFSSATEFAQHLESWIGDPTTSQSTRPTLASTTLPVPAPEPLKPGLPWKWIAVAALSLIAIGGGWVFKSRTPSGTATSATSKGPDISLAILPFHNKSTDQSIDWLGPSLAKMLSTDVGQSARMRIVSSDRVFQIMKDLRISSNTDMDQDTLRQVAELSNADTLVWGQYSKDGGQIHISAQLEDLKRHRSIPFQASAANEAAVVGTVTQLAHSIQQNLSLSSSALKELNAAAFAPSSQSAEALKSFNQGQELARQGNYIEAVKQFESATKADPNFALAFSMLAQTYERLGYGKQAEQSASKSVELSANLAPVEKYLIQATNARIGNNYQNALDAYNKLAALMPNDAQIHFDLGELYQIHGDFDKAHEQYAETLQLDPKHIEALRNIGNVESDRGNPKGSLDYLNRALSLAVELDDRQGKAIVLHNLGEAYKLLNRPQDALQNFQQSLEIRQQIGDKKGMADNLDQIASVYSSLGKSAEAEKTYKQELDIRQALGDQDGLGGLLANYGLLLLNSGRYEDALSKTKQSLQIEMQLGNQPNQVKCLLNIGLIYTQMAKFDDALMYHQRAVDLLQNVQLPGILATELNNAGLAYFMIGQYDQALHNYMRALEEARKVGDKTVIAESSDSVAELFAIQGRLGAALNAQEDALKNAQQLEHQEDPAVVEIQADYAHILDQLGRGQEAQKPLEESLAAARSAQDDYLVAKILNFQGDNAYYRGDLKAAAPFFDRAQQAATKARDRIQSLSARLNAAKVSVKEGRGAAAVATLKGLRKEADALAVKYLTTKCSLVLGEALLQARDYVQAQDELESTIRKSEDLGMKSLLPEAHYLLSEVMRKRDNNAEADHHLQQARELVEQMRQESKTDSLLQRSDLKVIVEAVK